MQTTSPMRLRAPRLTALRAALALAALLLLGGCLELDAQDVHARYDEAKDRLDVLVVHRGLFAEGGNGSSDKPLEKALADLEEAKQSGEVVFWCNWPFSLDLTREQEAPIAALLEHVDVENGGLFTDPRGQLCAFQFVRVRQVKAFVKKLNTLLEVGFQAGFAGALQGKDGKHQFDDDTRELFREFVRTGEKMLVVEPGRIELRLPLSAKDHRWLKAQIEDHFLDNMPREVLRRRAVAAGRAAGHAVTETNYPDAGVTVPGAELRRDLERAASFRFFWDNDLAIDRSADATTLAIGARGTDVLHLHKASDGLYHPLLLETLRERGETIEAGVPDQELQRRFDAFAERDAVLPPKLAERRRK